MLKKLLKYEFYATGRYLLPLLAVLVAASAAAGLSIRVLGTPDAGRAASVFAAIFVVLFFLSVMALAAVTVVVIVYRFYKNLLGSEGYLMHTLPVTVHQLIWSKLIAAVVWMAVTSVCIYGCLFGVAFRAQVFSELGALFERLARAYGIGAFELISVVVELCVLLLLGSVSSCLLFYASLAIGHSLPRNKLLASLGVFIGLGLLSQVFTMLLAVITGHSLRGFVTVLNLRALVQLGHTLLIGGIALNAAYCVALYLVTAHMLGKRLNLE